MHLERATVLYDFSVIDGQPVIAMPVTVLTAAGKVVRPKIGMIDSVASFSKELAEAARAITSGEPVAAAGRATGLRRPADLPGRDSIAGQGASR